LPWEIYLDWLADQGFDQLRDIDCAVLCNLGTHELTYYHCETFYLTRNNYFYWVGLGSNENTWAIDLEDMEEDQIMEDFFIQESQPLSEIHEIYITRGHGECT